MLVLSASILVIRCTSIVLLGMLEKKFVLAYIGTDMSLYLLFKFFEGDFWYWIPLGGNIEILSSLLMRITIKTVTDFTSLVQLRHPQEMGGVIWLVSMGVTMASLPAVILIYEAKGGNQNNTIMALRVAWTSISRCYD